MAGHKKKTPPILAGDTPLGHNPFGGLKGLIKQKTLPLASPAAKTAFPDAQPVLDEPTDDQLFSDAMTGVSRLDQNLAASHPPLSPLAGSDEHMTLPDDDAILCLERLLDCGEGFVVSDTPEYMEGVGYNVRKDIASRLHRGDFAISGHIDLHGMTVPVAREAFESFLKSSYLGGKGAVLVIHGRGLSSQGDAVLKNKVREWLGQSYWRKRVMAYASAQSHDGGAGATYILLRSRPAPKRK